MEKLNYLNIGCGNKFCTNWTNIDMVAKTQDVIAHNLLKGLPFADNTFDVVYHSHVLEHFPKSKGEMLIKECYRVLKKDGILRVVVPDLENIIRNYLTFMELAENDEVAEANYDCTILELFDQMIRNQAGGEFYKFMIQKELKNEEFLHSRVGSFLYQARSAQQAKAEKGNSLMNKFKKAQKVGFFNVLVNTFLGENYRVGKFRNSGEIHQWMYDKFSLGRLLKNSGFTNVGVKTAFESQIPKWTDYQLDSEGSQPYIPQSLYMEGTKLVTNK